MREKEIKNKFYVLQKPKHSILTVIVVDGLFPLSNEVHESLERLKNTTDIIFVFDDKTYVASKFISKKRFASIYGSNLWMTSGDGFLRGILKTLEYEREVLKSHTSILVSNLSTLGEVTEENLVAIKNVDMSAIMRPILKIERRGARDYYDVYSKGGIFGIKDRIFVESDINRYSSYRETSKFTYLRSSTINTILEFCEGSEEAKEYVDSFAYPDYKHFFASLFKYLELEYIDNNVEDVQIHTVGK